MRALMIAIALLSVVTGLSFGQDGDSHWDGRVRMGGVWLDETGNESTMPETYNLYDGFFLSSIYLKGRANPRTYLTLDLNDINQKNRRGVLDFRRTGTLRLLSRFTESRWVFDPTSAVDAGRKNWFNTLSWTPWDFLWFSADYNLQTRDGNRLGLFPGREGWLGTQYDHNLHRYRLEGQARADNGIGGTLAYDGVMQRDALDPRLERDGYLVSANFHVPGYYIKNLTHVLRGAVGRSEIRESGLGFDLVNFQYTGVWRALDWLRLRYRFFGSEVEDEATTLTTDNLQNDIDGTFSYRIASMTLGYGWEALDDDRSVTTTHKFRGALSVRDPKNRVSGRVAYDGRDKNDAEDSTLLRDRENQRLDVRVDAKPFTPLTLGARFSDRERKYQDLGTEADGIEATAYAAWRETAARDFVAVTEVGVEYTHADQHYDNFFGVENIVSNAVTGRVGLVLWKDLGVAGSFTYLEMEEDLDLEKSIISIGASYRFPRGILADVTYNVYNFDDYVLINRFYTANVVWFNVGYEFSTE